MARTAVNTLGKNILVIGAYLGLAKLGQLSAIDPGNITPIWAPSAVILFAVLYWGRAIWPGIVIGAFIGNGSSYMGQGPFLNTLLAASANGFGDLLCAIIGARAFGSGPSSSLKFQNFLITNTPQMVGKFLLYSTILGPLVSAIIGVGSLYIVGYLSSFHLLASFYHWLIGDCMGVLIFFPLMVSFVVPNQQQSFLRRDLFVFERLIFFALMLLSFVAVYREGTFIFLSLPLLLWAATRYGDKDFFSSVAVVSTVLAILHPTSIVQQQLYLFCTTIPLFFLRSFQSQLMDSYTRFSLVFNNAMDAIFLTRPNGQILSANPAACKMFDRSEEEFIEGGRDIILPPTDEQLKQALNQRKETGKFQGELIGVKKSGETFPVQICSTVFQAVDGSTYPSSIVRDISMIVEKEKHFQLLFNSANTPLAFVSKKGEILNINNNFTFLFGYTLKDIPTLNEWWPKAYPDPFYRIEVVTSWDEDLKSAAIHNQNAKEYTITCKDGSMKSCLVSASILGENFLATFVDVTELNKNLKRMNESQIASKIGSWDLNLADQTMWWSDEIYRIYEVEKANFVPISSSMEDFIHKDDQQKVRDLMVELIQQRSFDVIQYDMRIVTAKNTIKYCDFRGKIEVNHEGTPRKFYGTLADISDRIQMNFELVAEKKLLETTLRSIGDGVITTDTYANVISINKTAEELTGWAQKEVEGHPLMEVFHIIDEQTRIPCDNPVQKIIQKGGVVELTNHTVLCSKQGMEYLIADSGAPIRDTEGRIIGAVLVFRDVTEKQRLLEMAQKSDKLESIGLLAGGIAHDFNNLLTGVFGKIELALLNPKIDEKTKRYLESALIPYAQAKGLTEQLLTFSKGGAPCRSVGLLAGLLRESTLFALSGSSVQVVFEIESELWPCEFDKIQIAQVIDNLVINAKQAMPEGGKLIVIANNITINSQRFVQFSFQDCGSGISPDILPRVFDPFFTTKEKGNGLGLTTVYSIVTKHDGNISIKSRPGEGTVVRIVIPAASN